MSLHNISLRPWQREDAQALAAIANDRNIFNNLRDHLPHPYTVMDALQWIAHCKGQNPIINFAVTYNGKVAGSIGCVPKTDVYRKSIEIGYFIGEQFKGQGIATEAVRILLEYIQHHFDVVRIYAEVFAYNKASMRVLQKNGFYLESIRKRSVIKNNVLMDDYIWVKLF
jgi:[ribosomal protein S5]-alanine N-acetyltransferase